MSLLPRGVTIPTWLMRAVLRTSVRPVLDPRVPVRRQRRLIELLSAPIAVLPDDVVLARRLLGRRPTEQLARRGAPRDRAVLYLHGGGYTVGSPTTHRPLAAQLVVATDAPVYLLDYRLAPEHPFPAALDDAVAAYRDLLGTGLRPEDVVVAGDSAGGGLTLALALRLRDEGDPLPAALGLISPWPDLTLTGVEDDRRDPLLTRAWLESCATAYTRDTEPSDPLVSPLRADLAELPPVVLHASGDEILRADIERLGDRLVESGVRVSMTRLPELWHVVHLQAGALRPATEAVDRLGRDLAVHFAPASSRHNQET